MRAKIYVAAPSTDMDRYKAFVTAARDRGLEVTYDWTRMIEEAQRQGLTDRTITPGYAMTAALMDAQGVRDCSILVLLAPRPGEMSIGAWVELGLALGFRTSRPARKPLVVVSAPPREGRQYAIFEELADVHAKTDAEALDAAVRLAGSMELEDAQGIDLEELAALVSGDAT